MKKRIVGSVLFAAALILFTNPAYTSASGQTRHDVKDMRKADDTAGNIQLSAQQKKRLNDIIDRMQQNNKELVEAYTEYGLMKKEAKEKKLQAANQFFQSVKQHQYSMRLQFQPGELEYELPGKTRKHGHDDDWHEHDDDRHEHDDDDRHERDDRNDRD